MGLLFKKESMYWLIPVTMSKLIIANNLNGIRVCKKLYTIVANNPNKPDITKARGRSSLPSKWDRKRVWAATLNVARKAPMKKLITSNNHTRPVSPSSIEKIRFRNLPFI